MKALPISANSAAGASTATDPIRMAAAAIPQRLALGLGLAARLLGALVLAWLPFAESYDGTQVFAGAVAALVALSLVYPDRSGRTLAGAAGAGLLTYAGVVLLSEWQGGVALGVGTIASLAELVRALHRGSHPLLPVIGFFGGGGLMLAVGAVTVLLVEG